MLNLLILFLIPIVASAIAFLLPHVSARNLKYGALAASLIPLAMLAAGGANWLGARIDAPWLPQLSIRFHLAVDNLSLLFLFLTTFIVPVVIYSTDSLRLPHPHTYFGLILLLEGLLIGFFTSSDLALFTIFWESILIPLYFLINIWGGYEKHQAATKFIIYMVAGSTLMVASVLALYFASSLSQNATFDIAVLSKIAASAQYAPWIFAFFILAFAVKTPLFPLHGWLLDAYYQAPTAGTILLSALLSKAGIYGFIRIAMGFFPEFFQDLSPWLLGFAIAGTLYGALAAWVQSDFKRLLAYSSLSHVNFILAGLFIWNTTSHEGAVLQAINHGITITALFLSAEWLQARLGSTSIWGTSGLAKFMPHLCWFTLVFVLSSVALPGTNNFIGELLILFGIFGTNPWLAFLIGLTIILSVVYMLRWMQHTFFEAPGFFQEQWKDIQGKEIALSLVFTILILWIGIYPAPLLNQIKESVPRIAPSEKNEAQP